MITKILVTGCKGQLGNELQLLSPHYSYSFTFVDKEECDLTDKQAVAAMIDTLRPDAIINCAAYTAVDDAESHADMAEVLNAKTVQWLAKSAKQINALLIHISTDYVFDGTKATPYNETDETNPISMYGKTKLLGELAVKELQPHAVIIRTAWLYGDGKNFAKTMLALSETHDTLRVVNDQIGSPTSASELAKAIAYLEPTENYGLFHGTCEGICSWADFAAEVLRLAKKSTVVEGISTEEYNSPTKRPAYSVLENYMFKLTTDFMFADWHDAIAQYMANLPK